MLEIMLNINIFRSWRGAGAEPGVVCRKLCFWREVDNAKCFNLHNGERSFNEVTFDALIACL